MVIFTGVNPLPHPLHNSLPVVTPKKRGFFGFLYGGPTSPNPKKRVIFGQNHVGFFGDPLARLT